MKAGQNIQAALWSLPGSALHGSHHICYSPLLEPGNWGALVGAARAVGPQAGPSTRRQPGPQ